MAISVKPSSVAFLVYVDKSDIDGSQTRESIKNYMYKLGLTGFISPVHHESENYHIHILILRPSRCGFTMATWREIADIFNAVNNHVEIINHPHNYAAYLTHSRPEDICKEQFDLDDIIVIGDLNYRQYIKVKDAFEKIQTDDNEIIKDILLYINSYGVTLFSDLVDFAIDRSPNWLPVIISKTNFLKQYMRSIEYCINTRVNVERRRI